MSALWVVLAVLLLLALLWTAYVLLTPEPGDMLPVRLAEEPAGGLVREQL